MRGRDIVVNTLLGILLVSVFLVPFLVLVGVMGYVIHLSDHWVKSLLPATANSSSVLFSVILCVWSLVTGVANFRKRRWRNAFLYFVFLLMIGSMWFAGVQSAPAASGVFWQWPWFLILAAQIDTDLTRYEFFAGAALVGAVVAVDTGLLGSGMVSRITSACVLIGVLRFSFGRQSVSA